MPTLDENVSLRPYNTFGLDVQARYFARFASADELSALLRLSQVQQAEKLLLGGGSNLLLTQDFAGVVLKNEIRGLEISAEDGDIQTALMQAGAGESWHGGGLRIAFVVPALCYLYLLFYALNGYRVR